MSETSWSEKSGIARVVAVRFAVVLSVLAGVENFLAFLTLQARLVPVLTQGRLAFSEVDSFVAFGALGHFGSGSNELLKKTEWSLF